MRILYLGSFRLPNCDAAAPRVLNVARALREAGHDVSFISWGGQYASNDCGVDGIHRVDGFEYIITHELDARSGISRVIGKLTRGGKTRRLVRKNVGQYDCIITYNGSLSRWLLRFTRRHKMYLVNDITEWFSYCELKLTDRPQYAWNMHVLQHRIKNKIVISSYLDRYYHKNHNIVIPATCNDAEPKWQQGSGYALQMAGPYDGTTLIYAGNPGRKDLVHNAINAVQRLVDEGAIIRFLIVGITRESYLDKYASFLLKKNLCENIQFLGRVSQDCIPSFYDLADFMVLLREPTRKSNAGFPTKFAESITSGTPVIANITSDIGDYLHDGETGFVVQDYSTESIYQIIKKRVLPLSSQQIGDMKANVRNIASNLDYHFFIAPLQQFFDNLEQ